MLKQLLYYLEGLDESILNVNKYIVDDEFEFEKYTLEEFEKKFKRRFKNIIQEKHLLGFVGAVSRLGCWLKKSREIQWDYKNIVKRKGQLERLK